MLLNQAVLWPRTFFPAVSSSVVMSLMDPLASMCFSVAAGS